MNKPEAHPTRSFARFVGFSIVPSVAVWSIAPLFVVACAVGPDYKRPETRLPPAYAAKTEGQVHLQKWWTLFHDPVLEKLIRRAAEKGPDLLLAVARIRQARAERGVVAAGLLPEAKADASYTRSHNPSAPSSSPSVLSSYRAGIDAAWELDIFGRVRRNIEASDADLDAAIEDARAIQVTLFAEVGITYMNIRGFQRQIEIATQNLEAQKKTAEISHKKYEVGMTNGLDVANADAQVATTESQIPVLQAQALAATYSLCALVGEEPAVLSEMLSQTTGIPSLPPDVPVGLPSELLRRRPDIRRSEASLHGATARIGVATADFFPHFTLTGDVGYQSPDKRLIGTPSTRYWSVSPSVSLPILQIARIRWNVEASRAVQEESLIAYRKAILVALGEVETALVSWANEKTHRLLLQRAVENNRRAVDLSTRLYRAGKTDFLNVVTTQRSLFTVEDALAQSERSLAVNLITLYKALGGGWDAGD